MAAFDFNPSEYVDTKTSTFDPLPNGTYSAMISSSDYKATKAGTGHYIELVIDIIDGSHAGRKLWERLNFDNPNKQAEDIARSALNRLLVSCGKPDARDTETIHDIPFKIDVEVDRKDPTRNRIAGYWPSSKQTARPAINAVNQDATFNSGPKKAWER
jgi:hypothetical protein